MIPEAQRTALLVAFGARVCELRVERGLILADVARGAGMPVEDLDRIEDGDLETDALGVYAIARALGVPAPALFTD